MKNHRKVSASAQIRSSHLLNITRDVLCDQTFRVENYVVKVSSVLNSPEKITCRTSVVKMMDFRIL